MNRFHSTKKEIGGESKVLLLELEGVVDPGSLDTFRAVLDDAKSVGCKKIALNLQKLRYISSNAIDMLMRMAEELRKNSGNIVLLNVPPKVRAVMEHLGHLDFFTELADEEDAVLALDGKEPQPAYFKLFIRGLEKKKSVPEEPKADTKQIVQCGSCEAKLAVTGPGTYRCPRCRAILKLKEDGSVDTYPEKGKMVSEVTLPARQEYIEGLRGLLSVTAADAGVNGELTQKAVKGIERCACYLLENALSGSDKEKLHFLLESETGVLRVLVYSDGKQLDLEGTDLSKVEGLSEAARNLDLLKFSQKGGGNLFSMEKIAKK